MGSPPTSIRRDTARHTRDSNAVSAAWLAWLGRKKQAPIAGTLPEIEKVTFAILGPRVSNAAQMLCAHVVSRCRARGQPLDGTTGNQTTTGNQDRAECRRRFSPHAKRIKFAGVDFASAEAPRPAADFAAAPQAIECFNAATLFALFSRMSTCRFLLSPFVKAEVREVDSLTRLCAQVD